MATGSERRSRDPKWMEGCAHAQPEIGVFRPFFYVFSGMLCGTQRAEEKYVELWNDMENILRK